MILASITLITGLALSTISAYYSILGLMAIFAAAPIAIMVMGSVLEISKLVATVWLKQNWNSAPSAIKIYLIISVIVLMLITSLGVFGFLAQAHLDQKLPSSELTQRLEILDQKIQVEQDTIETNRRSLRQLDTAVDQIMSRSTDERGAARSSALRRSQQKERSQLLAEIDRAQANISDLVQQRAPLASNLRQVEAKVGPIKYLTSFFYGNTDPALLEKSVMWVILILIVVFDPLAVVLLLASQISFQKHRKLDSYSNKNTDKYPDYNDKLEKVVDELIGDVKDVIEKTPETKKPMTISEYDYQNLSKANIEKEIEKWVEMIRNNQASINQVPKSIVSEVKARI